MAVAVPLTAAPAPATVAFPVAGVEKPHLPHVLEFSGRSVLHFGQNIETPRELTAVAARDNRTAYNPNAYVCITVTALAKASSVDVEMGV